MRILILGGTRFIGPDVVRHLVGDGHAVTIFHRGQTEAEGLPDVAHIHGDRTRLADYRAEFEHAAPEAVIDMRPISGADATAVMETFRGITSRVVAISSADVYRAFGRIVGTEPGPPDPVPLTEDSPLREKRYPYRGEERRPADDPQAVMDDYDKIDVEEIVLGDPATQGVILRLPMVYGPRDGQHRFFDYVKRMDDGRPAIILSESQAKMRWGRSFVENVAAAIARAATHPQGAGPDGKGRIYNVAEPEQPLEVDVIRELGEIVGWTGEIVVVPDSDLPPHLAPGANLDQLLLIGSDRIRAELGYIEPVPRHSALTRTIAWERGHPPAEWPPEQFDYAAEDAFLARR